MATQFQRRAQGWLKVLEHRVGWLGPLSFPVVSEGKPLPLVPGEARLLGEESLREEPKFCTRELAWGRVGSPHSGSHHCDSDNTATNYLALIRTRLHLTPVGRAPHSNTLSANESRAGFLLPEQLGLGSPCLAHLLCVEVIESTAVFSCSKGWELGARRGDTGLM